MEAETTPLAVASRVDLGRELKSWLRRGPNQRLKVAAVAKRLGVSQSTLYAYLAGATLPPSEVLDDLLCLLAVPGPERRRLVDARDELQRRSRGDTPAPPTPRELPAEPARFVGRDLELAALDDLLTTAGGRRVPVVVLSGIAGVGKTALALRWGHRVASRFPDGSLYVDMLGFSPGVPRTAADVLAGFLRGLGTPEAHIPPGLDERAARFRTRVAGRRMLIVLDNAVDADQVRPLLPGEPGCVVVVTSRSELVSLRVRHDVCAVAVKPLSIDDSAALLGAQLPAGAVSAVGLHRLAASCMGLPLALRIVAAHAAERAERGSRHVDELVRELEAGRELDVLEVGDGDASVRAVFSWSEARLPPPAVRAFRLLGLQPLDLVDADAAARLLGVEPRRAREQLDLLVRAHLVQPAGAGRLGMHDLLRTYAREQAMAHLAQDDRDAALVRLVDHLVAAASRAMDVLQPADDRAGEPGADQPADAGSPRFAGVADAQAWLVAEWHNLVRAIACVGDAGWTELTRRLADVLRRHLDEGGRHADALLVLGHALDASRVAGDRVAECAVLRDLGVACLRLGRYDDALAHYRRALDVSVRSGDRGGQAGTLNNLGNLLERLGDYTAAVEHYERALPIARELGLRMGTATLSNNLGYAHLRLGRHDDALRECERSLEAFTEIGDIGGTARALGNLGEIHLRRGDHAEATARLTTALERARGIGATGIATEVLNCLAEARLAVGDPEAALAQHREALDTARRTGDRYEQARALEGIGHAHEVMGDVGLARGAWLEAHEVYAGLGVPEAARVRRLVDAG